MEKSHNTASKNVMNYWQITNLLRQFAISLVRLHLLAINKISTCLLHVLLQEIVSIKCSKKIQALHYKLWSKLIKMISRFLIHLIQLHWKISNQNIAKFKAL